MNQVSRNIATIIINAPSLIETISIEDDVTAQLRSAVKFPISLVSVEISVYVFENKRKARAKHLSIQLIPISWPRPSLRKVPIT